MDISNKTLAMFLVAAIVVSIAGTTISLNRLDRMSVGGPTGYATSDVGNVTVSVGSQLSIAVVPSKNTIAFQSCTPQSGADVVIDSTQSGGDGNGAGGVCPAYLTPTNIQVINDGNIDANVSINASNTGEIDGGTWLTSGTGDSWFAYRTLTNDSNGGCSGTDSSGFKNITNTAAWYVGCTNLTYGASNAMKLDIQTVIPNDADVASSYVELTFWAKNA